MIALSPGRKSGDGLHVTPRLLRFIRGLTFPAQEAYRCNDGKRSSPVLFDGTPELYGSVVLPYGD